MSTQTIRRPARQPGDPTVALRDLDTGATWTLPDRSPLSLGAAPTCDVCIPALGISAQHAILERTGAGLRLHDVSKNGTYVAGARVGSVELETSRIVTIADTRLVALSSMMLAATPALSIYLGLDEPRAVSNLLVAAYRDEPLLILGKPGAGQLDLARAVHAISPRRAQPLIDLCSPGPDLMKRWQLAKSFRIATAVVALGDLAPADLVRAVWAGLEAPDQWRWIIVAETEASASSALRMPHLRSAHLAFLRPLSERSDDRAALVGRLLAQHAPIELGALPDATQRLLTARRAYANLDELRETVRRIAMIATCGIGRYAAQALGIELEHLQLWAAKVGLRASRG